MSETVDLTPEDIEVRDLPQDSPSPDATPKDATPKDIEASDDKGKVTLKPLVARKRRGGRKFTDENSIPYSVRLNREWKDNADRFAARHGTDFKRLLISAIDDYIDNANKTQALSGVLEDIRVATEKMKMQSDNVVDRCVGIVNFMIGREIKEACDKVCQELIKKYVG